MRPIETFLHDLTSNLTDRGTEVKDIVTICREGTMSKARVIPGFEIAEILMLAAGVLVVAAIVYAI